MRRNLLSTFAIMVIMLITSLRATAQVAELEKYDDNKKYTYSVVSNALFSTIAKTAIPKIAGANLKMANLAKDIKCIQVVNAEKRSARKKLYKDVKKIAKRGQYTTLSQTGGKDSQICVYLREGTSATDQSALIGLIYSSDDCTAIALTGTFTRKDLQEEGE